VNPNMINQIFMESVVGCPVSNLVMCTEKLLEQCRSRVSSNQIILKIPPLIIETINTLLLNNHAMHDHASIHDLSDLLSTLLPSRVANNGPTRLQNTKCTLHILTTSFMFFRKPTIFFLLGITMCLHENPWCIDGS
jgi:hypothetical protein